MQAATDCRDTDHFYNFSHLCMAHYGLVFTVFRDRFFPSTNGLVTAGVPLHLAMISCPTKEDTEIFFLCNLPNV